MAQIPIIRSTSSGRSVRSPFSIYGESPLQGECELQKAKATDFEPLTKSNIGGPISNGRTAHFLGKPSIKAAVAKVNNSAKPFIAGRFVTYLRRDITLTSEAKRSRFIRRRSKSQRLSRSRKRA
jgi:hypothetical protein